MAGSHSADVRRTLRGLMVEFQDLAGSYSTLTSALVEAPPVRLPGFVGVEPRATVDDGRRDTWRYYDEGPPERSFYYRGSREGLECFQRLAVPAARCLAVWPEARRVIGLETATGRHGYGAETWTLALHTIAWSGRMETKIIASRSTPQIDERGLQTNSPDGPLLAPHDWRQQWHGIDIPPDCFMSQMYHDSLFANSVSLIDYLLSLPEEAPVAYQGFSAIVDPPSVPGPGRSPPAAPGEAGAKPPKRPPQEAFAAYRLWTQGGLDQVTIARKLQDAMRIPFDQSKVSRSIKRVERWLGAGNALPATETIAMDPRRLEQGPRRDRRRPGRRDDGDRG